MAFKLTGNVQEVTVPQEKMLKIKDVMEAILRQVDGEVVLVFDDVPDAHFAALMRRYIQLFFQSFAAYGALDDLTRSGIISNI